MTSPHQTTSNQRWNNVVYVNVGIYNHEQRPINAAYFDIDWNNVKQRGINADFQNVGQHRNNVMNVIMGKKFKK